MEYQPFTAAAYGINPGRAAPGAAGAGVPPVSAGAAATDRGLLPYHPDSPSFWVALFAVATVLGIAGAEVGARIGRGRARLEVGRA